MKSLTVKSRRVKSWLIKINRKKTFQKYHLERPTEVKQLNSNSGCILVFINALSFCSSYICVEVLYFSLSVFKSSDQKFASIFSQFPLLGGNLMLCWLSFAHSSKMGNVSQAVVNQLSVIHQSVFRDVSQMEVSFQIFQLVVIEL